MHILRKYHRQLDRFIWSGSCGAFSLAYGLLAILLAALAALIWKVGSPPMNGRPWDVPILLDGAWRIASGQVPHRDFYNHLGDLPFYFTALGMKLSRPCLSAIDYGNLVFMAIVVLPVMAVLRRRTSALLAFLYSLFVGLLVITPKPMGDPYDYIDHAMLYNRYGEAFIALFGAIVFLSPKPGSNRKWPDWAEAVLAGFALMALLGCKLNYFALGIGFLGVAVVTGRISFGWMLLCLASAAAFTAAALAISGIPLADLIKDYRTMSGCQSLASRIHGIVIQGVKSIFLLPVLLLPAWEWSLGESALAGRHQSRWPHLLVIAAIFGGAVLLFSTNCQLGELPLLALAALYGAEIIQRQTGPVAAEPMFDTIRHLGMLLLVLLFLLPPIASDFKTLRFVAFAAVKKNWTSTETLQSTRLSDFRFVGDGTRRAEMDGYMKNLDEGIQLLRRHQNPNMRLNAILFSDPFHLALGWIPSSGGLIGMSQDAVSRQSHPPLPQLLGNATHLMTERGCQTIKNAYGADWDALHLEVIEETESYTLFKLPAAAESSRKK